MTAPTVEQIAEVLHAHRAQWVGDNRTACFCGADWTGGGRDRRGALHAAHQAEQVAALGVGDSEVEERTEFGVRYRTRHFGTVIDPSATATSALDYAGRLRDPAVLNHAPDATAVQRCVTAGPWVEVTDEGGEG